MDSTTTLEPVLADAAEAAGFNAVFAVEEGLSWVAIAADETALALEWRADARRLVLSAEVGSLEAADGEMLRLLLRYNARWRETGGLRFALDEVDVAALVLDLPVDALDGNWLADVLAGFAEAAADWRRVLSNPAATKSSTGDTVHRLDEAGYV